MKNNNLETSVGKTFKEDFYFLCQEEKPLAIKKCFIKQSIREKITEEVISYGLMGAARTNKIENIKMLLSCGQEYNNMKSENIYLAPTINLAIKKDHVDLVDELIKLTKYFEWDTMFHSNLFIKSANNREKDPESFYNFKKITSKEKPLTIVEAKYIKFSGLTLIMYAKQSDKLGLLLEYPIHISHIKELFKEAIKENNIMALVSIVKSHHLEKLLEEKSFHIIMANDEFKEIKQEFQHLINNFLLEKKLSEKLTLKNTKSNQMKI